MGMDKRRAVAHLTVTNCVLRTDASHFKFGTESSGDLRHVTVTNARWGREATDRGRGTGSRSNRWTGRISMGW